MIFPGFCGPTYTGRSETLSAQRLMNLYPERIEFPVGKGQDYTLVGTPGFSQFADLSSYSIPGALYCERAALVTSGDRLFCIADGDFLEISSAGVVTDRGNITGGGSLPQIVSNGTELFLTGNNATGYVFTLATNTLSAAIGGVTAYFIAFLDGYFIAAKSNGEFYISALYDGTTWNAADFATAESSPDSLTGMLAHNGELWLFGQQSIEVWRNTGNADFPFERMTTIPLGVVPFSAQSIGGAIMLVGWPPGGGGVKVYRIEGYSPVPVSTGAIEELLAGVLMESAKTIAYSDRGHSFYVLSHNGTFVYDLTTNLWHERGSWTGDTSDTISSAVFVQKNHTAYTYAFGKHFVNRFSAAHLAIYEMSESIYTDALNVDSDNPSDLIKRIRRARLGVDEQHRLFYKEMQLDAISGPTWNLKWSDDNGTTWTTDRAANTRNRWAGLGSARDRIFQLSTTYSGGKVGIAGAYIDAEAGMH